MRIHVVSPAPVGRLPWLDGLRQRGHEVSQSDQVPADADLYLFLSGHEAMRHLARGLVLLDLRQQSGLAAASWAPYADLCLVGSVADKHALMEMQGSEPERIYVVTGPEEVLDLIERVHEKDLQPAEVPAPRAERFPPREAGAETGLADHSPETGPSLAALNIRLEVAEREADVMLRDYQVRSRIPLLGPLVAWIRRNLTSHLREPYLDPTLEKQVALNRDLVKALRDVSALLASMESQLSQPDEGKDDE